jgi:hypothetical protein
MLRIADMRVSTRDHQLLPLLGLLIACGDPNAGATEPSTGLTSPGPPVGVPMASGTTGPATTSPPAPALTPPPPTASASDEPDEDLAPNPSSLPEPEEPPASEPTSEPEPAAVDCESSAGQWQVCESGPGFCEVVFSDGAGCAAVCDAIGLDCEEAWEDITGECSPDTTRSPLGCGATGHQGDYCRCASTAGTAMPEPTSEPEPVEPTMPEPEAEPESQPEPVPEPAPEPEPVPEQPDVGPRACECEEPAGEFGTVNETIAVGPGQTYDGECQIFRANPGTLGDGSQAEGQRPVFEVNGGTLRNVVLGASAADGIHVQGNATLENVHWLDIGEDAMTVVGSGTITLDCGSATNSDDKIFQVNAPADIYISNFTASNGGKFMRQNGSTTFEMTVTIDHCDISSMDEVIYRTDSGSSHVTLSNTRYSGLGDGLFMFGSQVVNGDSGQSTVSNNQEY